MKGFPSSLKYAGETLGQTYVNTFQNQRILHSLQHANVHHHSPRSGLYEKHLKNLVKNGSTFWHSMQEN